MERLHEALFHVLAEFRRVPMRMSALFDLPPGEFMSLKHAMAQEDMQGGCGAPGAGHCDRQHDGREVNVSDLHARHHASMSALSQSLASLERKGYVTRSMSGQDRRKIVVALTPEGREIVQRNNARMDQVMRRAIERFGEAEARELLAQAHRFSGILDEAFSEVEAEMKEKGENRP